MTVHHPTLHVDKIDRLARWSVALAEAVVAVITLSVVIFGLAYAIGGVGATEDNWVGFLAATALLGGLLVSAAAFGLAIAAKLNHEHRRLLWLPLSVFPGLLAFLVLGELFWWE
jgi:hypothetical protein